MTAPKVYVVSCTIGQYSDQCHCVVAAFADRAAADEYARRGTERYDAICAEKRLWYSRRAAQTTSMAPLVNEFCTAYETDDADCFVVTELEVRL